MIHTLALDAALSTAGYVSNRLCAYQTARNQQMTLLSKKGLQEALWHTSLHPLESHAQSALVGFHMALRQKPPLLWQEAPAKAMATVFPASVSNCIALSISTPIFAVLLQSMMVSPICFTLF